MRHHRRGLRRSRTAIERETVEAHCESNLFGECVGVGAIREGGWQKCQTSLINVQFRRLIHPLWQCYQPLPIKGAACARTA